MFTESVLTRATPTSVAVQDHRLHNLRPVGGFPTPDGKFVRADLLWRSAAPFLERAAGTRAVRELGVHTIIDLRDSGERDRTPGAWAHNELTVKVIPVFNDRLSTIRFNELSELYSIMISDFGPRLATAFSAIVAAAPSGVLFHCTAGKDRTGMLSALILEVLEVERELILEDFSKSQMLLGDDYLADLFAGIDIESLPGLAAHRATMSPPELLAGALEHLDREHGGVEAFLTAHGVTEADFAALRNTLFVAGE